LAFVHGNYIILNSPVSIRGTVTGTTVGEWSEDTSLPEAERRAYWRKNAMKALLGVMIAHEDKYGRSDDPRGDRCDISLPGS
jgi:hypothetical protein